MTLTTTEELKHLASSDNTNELTRRLAREFLANREAQPVQGLELAGWQFKSVNGDWLGILDELGKNQAVREGCEVREVYAMTDSPNDRDAVREAHAEWSRSTFGNVGPIGPLKHLSKEALEAAAQPDDLSEWADMQFLLWDAQRRAGITDEQITQAMIEKLKVNMARPWPEPKDGEPRLHITAPPAPAKARPVAWEMRYWNSGHGCWHDWERISAEQHAEMGVQHATDNDYEFRVLYTSTPASQSTNAAGWGINMQTGTPILVYKNCSVIESEQAHYVLSLINSAAKPVPAVPEGGNDA